MKIISKIICGIFVALMLFIIVNLINGAIRYGGTKNYSEILNNKDWDESISQISILKPKTRISIFYEGQVVDGDVDILSELIDLEQDVDIESGDVAEEVVNHNPYDPDYEDEFNSFFGNTSEETGEIIPVQEIENLEPAGFVVDESTED